MSLLARSAGSALDASTKTVAGLATAAVVAKVTGFTRALRKHFATQRTIEDQLNTSTPGGLTDLVAAVKAREPDAPLD